MLIAYVPIIFIIIGLLIYALADGKKAEVGRIIFAAAFLVTMLNLASKTFHIG